MKLTCPLFAFCICFILINSFYNQYLYSQNSVNNSNKPINKTNTPKKKLINNNGSSIKKSSNTTTIKYSVPKFCGIKMTKQDALDYYGKPRKTELITAKSGNSYIVNTFSNYASKLLIDYIEDNTSFFWSMPFSFAFYYSKPNYVKNSDGSIELYPPIFSYSKLLFIFFALIAAGYILNTYLKIKKERKQYPEQDLNLHLLKEIAP